MISWLAWPAAALVGISLGMLGSGGSTLTVPLLHLLAGLSTPVAVATSFPVVGVVAFAGMAGYARSGAVRVREVIPFVLASVPAAFLARRLLAPLLSQDVQTYAFAASMLVVAWRMLAASPKAAPARHPALVLLAAAGVGVLTGCLGVGGGFVIVPALVLMLGFDVPSAIATSLLVIGLNCAASVVADHIAGGAEVRWDLAAVFGAVGVAGVAVGGRVARRLDPVVIKRVFASVVVVLAVVMVFGPT